MKYPLTQGSYQARGQLANAQSCINLYPEPNTPDGPFPMSHYPAPGLQLFQDFTGAGAAPTDVVRGLYQASNGVVFACVGSAIWSYYSATGQWTPIGSIGTGNGNGNAVSMCDNQTDLVITDISSNGWYVPVADWNVPNSLQQINDPAFYGSPRVDFIDTFLIFSVPGGQSWYSTTSNVLLPFDAQYFAAKEGWNDWLVCVAALHDNVWVLGNQTTEIWYNAGGSLFPFARMPNSVLQQGCVAIASPVISDNAIYWLSQDRWGRNMLIRGEGYAARRVSTFAVEDAWSKYPAVEDCIGMSYQIGGHQVVGLLFPSGNAWWGYDASTQQWHQRTYNGTTTAWLPRCMCFSGHVFGTTYEGAGVLAGDRTGPRIYTVTRNAYTDNGVPITRQRAWMHVTNEGHRVVHSRFQASFAPASAMSGGNQFPDELDLVWSDDGGYTYGNPVPQTGGQQSNGSYLWRRLGYARDRVYQMSWTAQGEVVLNGAWIDTIPQAT